MKDDSSMKKMRIGFFVDAFFPMIDGVVMVVDHYAKRLSKKAEVIVFAPAPTKGKYDDSKFPYKVVRCKAKKVPFLDYSLALPVFDKKFKKEIENSNLDIVHIHSTATIGFLGVKYGKKHNIPIIGTMHSQTLQDFKRAVRFNTIAKLLNRIVVKTYNKCDECWTVNKEVARIFYEEYGCKNKPSIIRNATEMEPVSDISKSREKIEKLYNINSKDKIFVFVGRINALKNIYFIVDSLKVLNTLNPPFKYKMLFIGSGQDEEELRKYIEKKDMQDNIIMVGKITDRIQLAEHYAASDLQLFPSLYDTNSLVQIEASSQHTPTLFIEGSATCATVTDKVNGFISKYDKDSYAKYILDIFTDKTLYNSVKEKCYQDLYVNWNDVVEEVYNRYKNILEEKK